MKYKKTELGTQLFQERNTALSFRQRSAFIMFDGEKDDSLIFKALAATGLDAADIQHLVDAGLIEISDGFKTSDFRSSDFRSSDFRASVPFAASVPAGLAKATGPAGNAAAAPPVLSEQERYQRAYPIATKLTSGLGLRGFRLNLSVESAAGYKDLVALAPKIKDAVGDEKFAELARALRGL